MALFLTLPPFPLVQDFSRIIASIDSRLGPPRSPSEDVAPAIDITSETLGNTLKNIDAVKSFVESAQRILWHLEHPRQPRGCIQRLPKDLLREVFLYVYENEERDALVWKGRGKWRTTVSAKVCKGWRNVAEGIPVLWTRISVDLASVAAANQLHVAAKWLGRCRDNLVSVRFYYGTPVQAPGDPLSKRRPEACREQDLRTLGNLLSKHLDNIETLDVSAPDAESFSLIVSVFTSRKVSFSELKTLIFSSLPGNDLPGLHVLMKAFPALERLSLPDEQRAFPHNLRWGALKAFRGRLGGKRLEKLCCGQHKEIEHVELIADSWSKTLSPKIGSQTLENLTALSLSSLNQDLDPSLFPRLPALRCLILQGGNEKYHPGYIGALLGAWGAGLCYLGIGFNVAPDDLMQALQRAPCLMGLRLRWDPYRNPEILFRAPLLTHFEMDAPANAECLRWMRHLSALTVQLRRQWCSTLESVAFYPIRREDEACDADRYSWAMISQDLAKVGTCFRDYRFSYHQRDGSGMFAFDTDFFVDYKLLHFTF